MFGGPRPGPGGPGPPGRPMAPFSMPRAGGVLTGTVKSYNAKGFGFILSPDVEHDVYFSRESLQQGLRTANIAGTMVSFELCRGPGGKPLARNLRPVHGIPPGFFNARGGGGGFGRGPGPPTSGGAGGSGSAPGPPAACGGFCGAMMSEPRRSWSPHAGSRAIAGLKAEEAKKLQEQADDSGSSESKSRGSSEARKRKSKRRRKRSRSRSGSGSSPRRRKKRRKASSKDDDSSSSSSPSVVATGSAAADAAAAATPLVSTEVDDAKKEALQKLQQLRAMEPKEARMKEFRALLRAWHPDKNPDKVEIATAVFQFLQKGKVLLDLG